VAGLNDCSVRRFTIWEGVPIRWQQGWHRLSRSRQVIDDALEPRRGTILLTLGIVSLLVFATRWPVARPTPFDSDEHGFVAQMTSYWFPMHHTLFMTLGRVLGSSAAIRTLPSSSWTCSLARGRS